MDIGNHRYTNVQNCILLKYKCDFCPTPPNPKIVLRPCFSLYDFFQPGLNYRLQTPIYFTILYHIASQGDKSSMP